MDVQPGLFSDSAAGTSVPRPAPRTTTRRTPAASSETGSATTFVAGATTILSRVSDHQRLHRLLVFPDAGFLADTQRGDSGVAIRKARRSRAVLRPTPTDESESVTLGPGRPEVNRLR